MRKIRQILFDFLSVVGRGAAPPARVLWSQTLRGYIPGRAGVSDWFFSIRRPGNTSKNRPKNGKKSVDLSEIFLSIREKLKSCCSGISDS